MTTKNLKLDEPALSDTFGTWLEMFNGNMGKIDSLPLPIEYGKNTTMEYVKLANGKIVMWGMLDHGTKYPCKNAWTKGFLSDTVTVDFPVALVKNTPTVLAMAEADTWKDVTVCPKDITYTTFTFKYWHVADDSTISNPKKCHIIVIGDWK